MWQKQQRGGQIPQGLIVFGHLTILMNGTSERGLQQKLIRRPVNTPVQIVKQVMYLKIGLKILLDFKAGQMSFEFWP